MIYDLKINKISNIISNELSNKIYRVKHYYYQSFLNHHILLNHQEINRLDYGMYLQILQKKLMFQDSYFLIFDGSQNEKNR